MQNIESQELPIKLLSEVYNKPGIYQAEKGDGHGDCFGNTQRLIKELIDREVSMKGWKVGLLQWTGGGDLGAGLYPDNSMLRQTEHMITEINQNGGFTKSKWGYHVFLISPDNRVLDLSANEDAMGLQIEEYLSSVFSEHHRRFKDQTRNEIGLNLTTADDFLKLPAEESFKNVGKCVEMDDIFAITAGKEDPSYIEDAYNKEVETVKELVDKSPGLFPPGFLQIKIKEIDKKYEKRRQPLDKLLSLV